MRSLPSYRFDIGSRRPI